MHCWVRFTPFPESKLAATKKALRDKAGQSLGNYANNNMSKECT